MATQSLGCTQSLCAMPQVIPGRPLGWRVNTGHSVSPVFTHLQGATGQHWWVAMNSVPYLKALAVVRHPQGWLRTGRAPRKAAEAGVEGPG